MRALVEPGGRQRISRKQALHPACDPVTLERRERPVCQKSIPLDVFPTEFPRVEKQPGKKRVDDDIVSTTTAEGDAAFLPGGIEGEVAFPEPVRSDAELFPKMKEP